MQCVLMTEVYLFLEEQSLTSCSIKRPSQSLTNLNVEIMDLGLYTGRDHIPLATQIRSELGNEIQGGSIRVIHKNGGTFNSLSARAADLGGNDVGLLILMFSHHTSAAVRMPTKKTATQQRGNRMEKVGQGTQWGDERQ